LSKKYYSVAALTGAEANKYLQEVDDSPAKVYDLLVDKFMLSPEFIKHGKNTELPDAPYGLRDRRYARPLKGGKGSIVLSWNHAAGFVGMCIEENRDGSGMFKRREADP